MSCPGLNNAPQKFPTIQKNPDFIMTFSKNNYLNMNILTHFQNHVKIKKILTEWQPWYSLNLALLENFLIHTSFHFKG